MITTALDRLQYLCEVIPPLLQQIDEASFTFKPQPAKWSKKEILGHLIDSAANNHQRFVRTQFEEAPAIAYDQNQWNTFSYHQQIDTQQLISFWTAYNKQLLALASLIPASLLGRECNVKGTMFTLEFIITDYVSHLEHHLRQIVAY
ncbi:DinB family protein [Chitinophaga vietnamensis]|uniref:DinB family protein n=1 Tax=Chitinophaga vietnamensis TaxID=2593957 RepID=UPI001177ABAD|nr:DinB family protein [Chitinophaga vietnamensis]